VVYDMHDRQSPVQESRLQAASRVPFPLLADLNFRSTDHQVWYDVFNLARI
jgi:hypothetical protein